METWQLTMKTDTVSLLCSFPSRTMGSPLGIVRSQFYRINQVGGAKAKQKL